VAAASSVTAKAGWRGFVAMVNKFIWILVKSTKARTLGPARDDVMTLRAAVLRANAPAFGQAVRAWLAVRLQGLSGQTELGSGCGRPPAYHKSPAVSMTERE
jgi:hypothetical protein